MKSLKTLISRVFLVSLCLLVLLLAGCEYLPIDLGDLPIDFGNQQGTEDAHEHILVEHEGVEATCTEGGCLPYVACSECEYTTFTATEALGHDFSDEFIPSGDDQHSRFCTRCTETVSEEHEWVERGVYTEPTCLADGSILYGCSDCTATRLEPTAALGHDFSGEYTSHVENHTVSCTRCDETITEDHEWNENALIVSEPTCVLEGVISFSCAYCGESTTSTVDPLGHDFDTEFTENGASHRRECTRCTASIDEQPHTFVAGEILESPTCSKTGTQLYTCTACTATKTETLDETDHIYADNYVPNGDVHSRFCTGCGVSVDAPHYYVEGETTKAATCTEDGTKSYVCTGCSDVKIEAIPMLGHDFSDTYAPNGDVHSLYCSRCDATSDASHAWTAGEVITTSTCLVKGTQLYSCDVCGETKTEELPLSDEHIDGGWETLAMPTATVRGKEQLRCTVCNEVILVREIACDADSMSVLHLTGEYEKATAAKNEVPMQFNLTRPDGTTYEGYAKMKVQGSSSVAYAKKNYTLKLYKDSEFESKNKINVGWGKENKYVIKANWVDFSNARNVVSCRLWGDIVASRATSAIQQRLASLSTNGGAIDGFPVAVYMNGEFYGLYTFNVPKDEWMFGMDDSETEAILGADDWNHTDFNTFVESFYEDKNGDLVSKAGGWELVYCGSDDYSWVAPSFDALIAFVQNNDGEAFRSGISEYLDVDAAIDYIIYMYAVLMRDNASKNMLWITYDGKVWTPSAYDQDGTFGQSWDGINAASPTYCLPTVTDGKINPNIPFGPNSHPVNFILWDKILNCFTEEVLLRYKELRETTLSVANMQAELRAFEESVPTSIYEADRVKWAADREKWWANKNGQGVWYEKYHFEYMYTWIESRMANYDNVMRNIYNNVYLPKTSDPAL